MKLGKSCKTPPIQTGAYAPTGEGEGDLKRSREFGETPPIQTGASVAENIFRKVGILKYSNGCLRTCWRRGGGSKEVRSIR